MRKIFIASVISILLCGTFNSDTFAQGVPKIQGPLMVYRLAKGWSYNNPDGSDSIPMQDYFRFGELGIGNFSTDNGMTFVQEMDSCEQWKVNRAYGLLVPPSEGGTINNPADTALYCTLGQTNSGMTQGGQRFSRFSKIFGNICGVFIDDFETLADTSYARKVRDAVRGKYVDAGGNVHTDSIAHTPYNTLTVVRYNTTPQPSWQNVIDGIAMWHYGNQSSVYTNMDTYINQLRTNFPKKELFYGIYVDWGAGSSYAWASPASFQYMLSHGLNRYDDGDLNGLILFQGYWLVKPHTSLSIWNQYNFNTYLDSLYFPYLGMGEGQITDCTTGDPLQDVSLRVFCKGRVSGDTLMRARQATDALGSYQFGLWAGNRTTDSTQYWLIAEKDGYISDTVYFWINRLDTTFIGGISLCQSTTSITEVNRTSNDVRVFPNPSNGQLQVMVSNLSQSDWGIYNMLGEKVLSGQINNKSITLNLTLNSGIYFLRVSNEGKSIVKKIIIE